MEEVVRGTIEALRRIEEEVNKLFRDLASKYPSVAYPSGAYEPPIDIEEREDAYVVYADVPGFSKEDIKITVGDNYVEIEAQKSEEEIREAASRNYVVRQRSYESIKKRVELPSSIKPEEARAKLENGVLVIHLPKRVVGREIPISIE
mgnify:FL=1